MSIEHQVCKICGSNIGVEQHHMVFRSQNRALSHCKINLVYLCHEHHRELYGVHGKKGEAVDLQLKLEFQNLLEFLFDKEYLTAEEINEVLDISDHYLDMLLNPLEKHFNTMYKREDVIKQCMGGKIYDAEIKEE